MTAAISELGSDTAKPKRHLKKMAIMIAIPLTSFVLIGALWFFNVLPTPFGATKSSSMQSPQQPVKEIMHAIATFVELPEIVTNLNVSGRRPAYIKLKAIVQLAKFEDKAVFAAVQPHILDLFQTYMRELHPEELRGSAGSYRLREELIARVNLAMAPGQIVDIVFSELLVQ